MTSRAVWPELGLAVTGNAGVLRHFEAEYGRAGTPSPDERPGVELSFGTNDPSIPEPADRLHGRLKTTSWRARLGSPAHEALRAELHVSGVFGLPLVQSLVVEPLLSISFARHGRVLVPAAGIVGDAGALILLGGPRAGKSSLAVRTLAAGRPILGDDHVTVGGDGRCRGFPRRLRLYPDLPATAPLAYAALPATRRIELRLREVGRRLSRGAIRLPALVPVAEVAPRGGALTLGGTEMPTERVVLLGRSPALDEPTVRERTGVELAGTAVGLLQSDRAALEAGGTAWQQALAGTASLEREILGRAWASVPAGEIAVPSGWPATRALEYFAARLGLPT